MYKIKLRRLTTISAPGEGETEVDLDIIDLSDPELTEKEALEGLKC